MLLYSLPGAICFLFFPTLIKAIACYAPDGSLASTDFQPCIAVNGVDSMCCGIARSSNLDVCMPNGLCLNSEKNAHFRDYCTDKTWSSPNCLPKETCSYQALGSTFVEMTQCANGSWCCGVQNYTDCCNKSLGFALKADLVTFNADTAQTITLSTTSTATKSLYTSIPTAEIAPISNSVEKKGQGITWTDGMVKLMIGVTVALAILAIVGTTIGFWAGLRRGRGRAENENYFPGEYPKQSYTQSPSLVTWGSSWGEKQKPLPKQPRVQHEAYGNNNWKPEPSAASVVAISHEVQGQSRVELGT